jgi:hypothetical protein
LLIWERFGSDDFIKERDRNARGLAAAYLNRYKAPFSTACRSTDFIADDIYPLMTTRDDGFASIESIQSSGLSYP